MHYIKTFFSTKNVPLFSLYQLQRGIKDLKNDLKSFRAIGGY